MIDNDGFHLKDGGLIENPDDDGTIRRRDVDGNCEEVRNVGDDDYQEWLDLFLTDTTKAYRCSDCGSFEIASFDDIAEVGSPHCADCGVDKDEV